jgi:Leucine-rich repeat (LRR) protein
MPKDIEDCMEEMNPQDKDAPMAVKGEAVPETSPAITIRKDLNKTPNGSTAAGFKNRTRLILACVVVTLLAAFGAVLGLYVAKDEDQTDCDDKASEDLPDENTTAPNENPFLEDPKLARLYSILEPIASSGFYTKDPDDEEDLPEYKAWTWLSERDMSLDTNRESTPDWKIVERYVLAAFFYATNGEEWDNTYGFLSNSPVCDWKEQNEFHYGVRFCSDEGSVTMLHIPANNLEGPIPTLLGLLINLVSLDLPGNSLAGTLPSELSKLTRLTGKLDLSRNLLTGTISSSIGRLVDLTELHLNENRLDGAIPTEIALMTSLTTLHLSSNQMTDGIPHELGRLDRLEDLRLDDNMLSGRLPSSLGNLSSIRKLHLHQNQLSGTVPSSFSQLQNRSKFRRQTTFA